MNEQWLLSQRLQYDLNGIIPVKVTECYLVHGIPTRNTGCHNTVHKLCPSEGLLLLFSH